MGLRDWQGALKRPLTSLFPLFQKIVREWVFRDSQPHCMLGFEDVDKATNLFRNKGGPAVWGRLVCSCMPLPPPPGLPTPAGERRAVPQLSLHFGHKPKHLAPVLGLW